MTKRRLRNLVLACVFLFVVAAILICYRVVGYQAEYLAFASMVWLFVGVLAVLALVGLRPSARRRRLAAFHISQGLCANCGYDLRAHAPGSNCPECGQTILPGNQSPP